MSVIAKCDYETALSLKGKGITTKIGNKKHKVVLRVLCDDFSLRNTLVLAKNSPNIVCVEFQGSDISSDYSNLTAEETAGINLVHCVSMGNELDENDILMALNNTPYGVTTLIAVPEGFSDLQRVWTLCNKFPNIRFVGGNLFAVDGVKLGYCGRDILDKHGVKYDVDSLEGYGEGDALETFELCDLEYEVSDKPEKKSSNSSSSSGKSAPKKKKQLMFSSLMQGTGDL